MTSTGAGLARPELERGRALRHENLEPGDDPSAGSRGRARGRRLRVGQVDQRLPRPDLDEHLVALGRRVDDEVGVAHVGRPRAAARELRRVRQRMTEGRRRAAVADDRRPFGGKPFEDRGIRRVPLDAPVADDQRVDRRQIRLAELAHGELVRRRDVRAGEAEVGEARDRLLHVALANRHERVRPVEPALGKRGVLHPRRQRARQRVAEQPD